MKNNIRHGDVSLHQISELPENLKEIKHSGSFALALGEVTGHSHKIISKEMQIFQDEKGLFFLKVNQPAQISHEEHKTVTLMPGIYKREMEQEFDYFLETTRQVQD